MVSSSRNSGNTGWRNATRLFPAARAYVARASRAIALDAVQMHGGMGMTEELDISHWLRRILVTGVLFGTPADHLRVLATRGFH